jgi:hypothetical protein
MIAIEQLEERGERSRERAARRAPCHAGDLPVIDKRHSAFGCLTPLSLVEDASRARVVVDEFFTQPQRLQHRRWLRQLRE